MIFLNIFEYSKNNLYLHVYSAYQANHPSPNLVVYDQNFCPSLPFPFGQLWISPLLRSSALAGVPHQIPNPLDHDKGRDQPVRSFSSDLYPCPTVLLDALNDFKIFF